MIVQSEFYALLERHFENSTLIGTNPTTILWKHRVLTHTYAYTSVDERQANYQIMFVNSTESELNESSKFAVKHGCQSIEQLDSIVNSLVLANRETGKDSYENSYSSSFYGGAQREPLRDVRNYSVSKKRSASKWYENKVLLAVLGIVILAIATNPKIDDHRDAIEEKVLSQSNSEQLRSLLDATNSGNGWKSAGAAIGYSLSSGIIDKMLSSVVHRRNFLVFSLTEVRIEGNSKIVGVGILGNVWIVLPSQD